MKKTSKPIVFFGNERLATGVQTTAPTLTKLIESGYNVVAVVASNDFSSSRKQRQLEIADVAQKYNIPLLLPKRLSDVRDQLQDLKAELGILVAYGKIIPSSIINIFPLGIVNIHPSLLPLHRGPTPIESVILSGESKTGVSIMGLAKEMDAGPIYAQETVLLNGKETKQKLADDLLQNGGDMLIRLLPDILAKRVDTIPQNDSMATYDSLIQKKDGLLDWQKPAKQLEREVRAYSVWPGSRAALAGKEIIVTQASIDASQKPPANPGDVTVNKKSGAILVQTTEESLAIERLKPAGKQEMPATAFVAGHHDLLK